MVGAFHMAVNFLSAHGIAAHDHDSRRLAALERQVPHRPLPGTFLVPVAVVPSPLMSVHLFVRTPQRCEKMQEEDRNMTLVWKAYDALLKQHDVVAQAKMLQSLVAPDVDAEPFVLKVRNAHTPQCMQCCVLTRPFRLLVPGAGGARSAPLA